ncbi:MAG: flippase [Ruminococcus sp.]|nr:flippase [Ruminococcus sp.]
MASIKKNFTYQMIYEVLILILPFVTSPYVARVIGAEGLGVFSYSVSIAYYFVLFSMLGLKNHGNRAIAQCRDDSAEMNRTFSGLLVLHMFVSVVCTVTYLIYALFICEDRMYALLQIFYVISALFDISWFYFGIEKFKMTVTRNVIIKILNVACVFIFVRDADDLWIYCLIMSLGHLVSQLALWAPLHRYVKLVRPEWSVIRKHIKPMLILFIPAVAVSLYKYMDKIMIGKLADKTQLGYYENAEKVINIPLTIIGSFGTVMLPKMSNLAAKANVKSAQNLMKISMKYVMCLAFALTCGLAGVGTVFAPVFWGKEFVPSGVLIMGLAVTIPFLAFANVIRTQYLIPKHMDREYTVSVMSGAVINLVINALLIGKLGAKGAVIGTIAAEILVCVIQTFAVRKQLPLWDYMKSFSFFMPVAAVMFTAVFAAGYFLQPHISTLLIQIAIGVIIYASIVILYFVKTKDETFLRIWHQVKSKLHKA